MFVNTGVIPDHSMSKSEILRLENLYELQKSNKRITFVTSKIKINSYKDIFCTCRHFLKLKACIHVFTILQANNQLDIIELPLTTPRKHGRPQ